MQDRSRQMSIGLFISRLLEKIVMDAQRWFCIHSHITSQHVGEIHTIFSHIFVHPHSVMVLCTDCECRRRSFSYTNPFPPGQRRHRNGREPCFALQCLSRSHFRSKNLWHSAHSYPSFSFSHRWRLVTWDANLSSEASALLTVCAEE
jgi:hypothetical protein